jgi:hypothetical protein
MSKVQPKPKKPTSSRDDELTLSPYAARKLAKKLEDALRPFDFPRVPIRDSSSPKNPFVQQRSSSRKSPESPVMGLVEDTKRKEERGKKKTVTAGSRAKAATAAKAAKAKTTKA